MEPELWFGWFRPDILVEYRELFWRGALMPLGMTVVCVLLGGTWGLLLALARLAQARHAPWNWVCRFLLRWPSTVYVSFFRGTPLFVQILLMHFAVMPLFIHPVSGWVVDGELARTLKQEHGALISGIAALTLNSAAYISEVFRAGIQSISKGQFDAGRSLGFTPMQVMRYVVLPQAFRRMLPPLGNNMIALLKDTSLVSTIALVDLMRQTNLAVSVTKDPMLFYTVACFIYLFFSAISGRLFAFLERHFNRHIRSVQP